MNNIPAILVDDEINARENLRFLLQDFCKNVTILAEASNVCDALELIELHQPKLVFLDVEMPQKNGFQLFNELDEVNFQVIFVTAYNNYAIKAFQVAAIDYLLKPIEVSLLIKAVDKVALTIQNSIAKQRINLLETDQKEITKIAVPYKNDYSIIDVNSIFTIEADRMYSLIHLQKNKKFIVAKKLSYYENLLRDNTQFVRIHRSWIINTDKIVMYSKKEKLVILKDNIKVPLSKSYKDKFENIFFK